MLLTITNISADPVEIQEMYSAPIAPGASLSVDRNQYDLSTLRSLLSLLQQQKVTVSTLYDADDLAGQEAGLLYSPTQTSSALAPNMRDSDAAARTLAALGPVIFEPTAQRSIDVPGLGTAAWDLSKSAVIRVYKGTRALNGILLDVSTHGGGAWTTPAGLNQDFFLPGSMDQLCGAWDVIIDGPTKTVRVVTYPRGTVEPMVVAPNASAGDTLDLFAGGTYAGHAAGGAGAVCTYQTAAPKSDGTAFITAAVDNVRRLQDIGDGNGQRLLMESARQNQLLHSQDLYTGAAITGPWVAIGATTGLGQQAGSPMADATVTNLIFTASAADGIKQAWAGSAVQVPAVYSVYVRCTAGTEKCRLQALLRDGTTQTSADFVLTTTWRRIDMLVPFIGPAGSAGTPEFQILNGSDGLARTIQAWGAMVECAASVLYPSSYIKTVGAVGSRTADSLYYLAATVPASFRTRGMSISFMPEFNNVENWGLGQFAIAGWDNPGVGISIAQGFDVFLVALFKSGAPYAGGAARIYVASMDAYAVGASAGSGPFDSPQSYSGLFSFARRVPLTLDAEAYRGAVRVQGATQGNGRYALGGGPWQWPTGGALFIASSSAAGARTHTFCDSVGTRRSRSSCKRIAERFVRRRFSMETAPRCSVRVRTRGRTWRGCSSAVSPRSAA